MPVHHPSTPQNRTWLRICLEVASKEAEHAGDKVARLATARFTDSLQEGPAQGLKRQRLYSRGAIWVGAEQVQSAT